MNIDTLVLICFTLSFIFGVYIIFKPRVPKGLRAICIIAAGAGFGGSLPYFLRTIGAM